MRDEIVVPVYQAAQEWRAIRPDHALTYYSIGAMGQASSAALGLALGRPDKRVLVLDGDGSLLMNLGYARQHCQPEAGEPAAFRVRERHVRGEWRPPDPRAATASASSGSRAPRAIAKTFEIAELGDFEMRIAGILREAGPVLIDLKLEPGEPPPQDYTFIHGPGAREAFRAALRGKPA